MIKPELLQQQVLLQDIDKAGLEQDSENSQRGLL